MAGNWKMNLNHYEANKLVQKLAHSLTEKELTQVEVVVLPPFTDIRSVQTAVDGDKWHQVRRAGHLGAASGAYTGEVSGAMLAKLGCSYAVVGHSERRQYHDETTRWSTPRPRRRWRTRSRRSCASVRALRSAKPGARATHAGPARRRAGRAHRDQVARCHRVRAGLGHRHGEDRDARGRARRSSARSGTGWRRPTPVWRRRYGSSTADRSRPTTSPAIMEQPDIDGALVGGASIDAEEFVKIVRYQPA
jgi:triosephosphate isomerase